MNLTDSSNTYISLHRNPLLMLRSNLLYRKSLAWAGTIPAFTFEQYLTIDSEVKLHSEVARGQASITFQ